MKTSEGEPTSGLATTARICGVIAGGTAGLFGSAVGVVIGSHWSDSTEGAMIMALVCMGAGLALGLPLGIAAGFAVSRAGAGASRRFVFTVLASFAGVLMSLGLQGFLAPLLLSCRPLLAGYRFWRTCIDLLTFIIPVACGLAGYLRAAT